MNKTTRQWYYDKLVGALDKAEIRWELHPKVCVGGKAKPECVQGYCQWQPEHRRYLIVLRYRPSESNHLYCIIHEGLHAAFPHWDERECFGEPVDYVARYLLFDLPTNQLKKLESYLPGR